MNDWIVNFETHSRTDVMKICALLAKGIGRETLCDRRVQVKVAGPFKIGKTAVTDGLAAAFVDEVNHYSLSEDPLIESYAGEAMDRHVYKEFTVNGLPSLITLSRKHFALSKTQESIDTDTPKVRGLDFITSVFHYKTHSDISIRFNDLHEGLIWAPEWERVWQIRVNDEALQTSEMEEILNHILAFHDRRQARRNAVYPPELN
nr:hypothetical protein 13 [Alphaproteobacteria bacterium]